MWTLHKNDRVATCTIHSCGKYGWDVREYRDGAFFASRRFDHRAEAVEWAEESRRVLESDGWVLARPSLSH